VFGPDRNLPRLLGWLSAVSDAPKPPSDLVKSVATLAFSANNFRSVKGSPT
jgi:hypothetical protein